MYGGYQVFPGVKQPELGVNFPLCSSHWLQIGWSCYIHTSDTQMFLIIGIIQGVGYILLFEVTRASLSFETCSTDLHDGETM